MKQTKSLPNPAIVFKTNVVYSDSEGRSVFLPAGEPSPFKTLADVPERLKPHVGEPDDGWRQTTPNQYFVSPEVLAAERESIEALNNAEDLPETVREALAERNEQYLRDAAARARVETEAAQRDLEEVARIKREKELEADELLEAQGMSSKQRKEL